MTIADELQHYNDGLLDAYDAVDAKGGTIPQNKNLDNLPTAIGSISGGGGGVPDPEEVYRQTRPADWLKMPEIGENEDNVIYLLLQIDANATTDIFFDYGVTMSSNSGTTTWEFGSTDSSGVFTPNSALTVTKTGTASPYSETYIASSNFGNTTSEGLSQLICKITVSGATFTQTRRSRTASEGILGSLIVEAKLKATAESSASQWTRSFALRYYSNVGESNLSAFNNMFSYCYSLRTVLHLDTSSGTNFGTMFQYCYALVAIPQLDTSSGTIFTNMFSGCRALTQIPLLDTSSGTSFSSMFQDCYSLVTIPLLDTSNGAVSAMFNNCYALQSVPQLDTSSSTVFANMFANCYALQSVPQLDTSSGTNFNYMFQNCYSLTEMPQLDTAAGTSFNQMFNYCSSLTKVDLRNYDFSQATGTGATGQILSSAIRAEQYVELGDKWPSSGITNTNNFLSPSNYATPSSSYPAYIKINKTDAMLPISANASTLFGSNQYIYVYVPDALLATYQADSKWATLGARLKGFSDLPS